MTRDTEDENVVPLVRSTVGSGGSVARGIWKSRDSLSLVNEQSFFPASLLSFQ